MTVLSIPSEATFTTADNFDIFQQTWSCKEAKGVVLITHGVAEHSGRYAHVAQSLVDAGYTVVGFDLRGHGKSSGKRNYINSFQDYLNDFQEVLNRTKAHYPDLPLFLFGHSMGGEIIAMFLIERGTEAKGVLLSAPTVKINDDLSPFLQKISGLISAILPKLPAVKLESGDISKDPAVINSYDEDPLNYRGGILARTGAEILNTTKTITARAGVIDLPILIMHGSSDKLTDVSGSEMLYANVSSKDKTLKIYEGLYHEILNEPEQDEVKTDIINWLNTHI
ncbi:MAG: alpha/beta hydrolase [Candidatus Marinimicrobia bacterium]|jgi:acylglycerol lipase|nr:alpha/beta hydrolase [Candidatus Neomarinimicrobiota bacterium]MBT4360522.1 alpha/beta hydrolase [Candidatus Neomarinimicrobiota bacterium]MBT4716275.1 alpha/beta hydrolase [Candidatus Neomarinimicrobiota bacterium]MBT4945263.1 alpha/beta hydrolase [Candidatus Neomarinimicrobiota bacterium]MBT5269177.1 alpha/beta hydrolase [Candidatus Neomarinimicrobiota bacterium]